MAVPFNQWSDEDQKIVQNKYNTYYDKNNADFRAVADQMWRKYNGDDIDATYDDYRTWIDSFQG
jgi:hypothetical protein